MAGGDGFFHPLGTGVGGATEILAVHSYNPGTQVDAATSSTSFVDVDATNMAVTFVAPASGEVLIDVSSTIYVGAGIGIDWGLRDASGDIAGTGKRIAYGSSGDRSAAATIRNVLTGLTASASYTVKLAHRCGVGSGTVTTRYGGTARGSAGAAVFVVTAIP